MSEVNYVACQLSAFLIVIAGQGKVSNPEVVTYAVCCGGCYHGAKLFLRELQLNAYHRKVLIVLDCVTRGSEEERLRE